MQSHKLHLATSLIYTLVHSLLPFPTKMHWGLHSFISPVVVLSEESGWYSHSVPELQDPCGSAANRLEYFHRNLRKLRTPERHCLVKLKSPGLPHWESVHLMCYGLKLVCLLVGSSLQQTIGIKPIAHCVRRHWSCLV